MNYCGSIDLIEYQPETLRLTIAFDTLRKMVFYKVPGNIAALLSDANAPDEAFALYVVGKFEWAEIGGTTLRDPLIGHMT
ncbi:MAG: hypothetical protein ABIW82_11685 [Dokdonella sp.]